MIDWKSKIDNAKDFFQIYWDGDHKYIRLDGYYYDEGQDNGDGKTTRLVEYSDYTILLHEYLNDNFDYDEYASSCKQYMSDHFYDKTIDNAKYYYGEDVEIKELAMSEINMETPEGFYVDV